MSDSFFGFNTDLPPDDELEPGGGADEVDEFNDVTFGADADEWEEESHQLAAELLERERRADGAPGSPPASTPTVVEPSQLSVHLPRLDSGPPGRSLFDSVDGSGLSLGLSPTVRTSIQTESSLLNRLSIGSVVSSPRSATSQYMAGISSLPAERAVPPNAKVRTVAELERDMMMSSGTGTSTAGACSHALPAAPDLSKSPATPSRVACALPDLTRPPPSLPLLQRPSLPEIVTDPYRGLMTNKDRLWLLNIQRLQVMSNDDFYFKHYNLHKLRGKSASAADSHTLQEKIEEKPQQPQLEKRDYHPPLIENALGKLRTASVTAPRRIIDVSAQNDDDETEGRRERREAKRDRLVLLTIEQLYLDLLNVEEYDAESVDSENGCNGSINHPPTPTATANSTPQPPSADSALTYVAETEPLQRKNSRDRSAQRLIDTLHDDELLASVLCVSKGKKLVLRCMPIVPSRHYVHIVSTLFGHLPRLVIKDRGTDLITKFHALIQMVLRTADLKLVVKFACDLTSDLALTSSSVSSSSPFCAIVSSSFGVSALVLLLLRGQQLAASPVCDSSSGAECSASSTASDTVRSAWGRLFTQLVTGLNTLSQRVASPLQPLPASLLSSSLPLSQHLLATLSAE